MSRHVAPPPHRANTNVLVKKKVSMPPPRDCEEDRRSETQRRKSSREGERKRARTRGVNVRRSRFIHRYIYARRCFPVTGKRFADWRTGARQVRISEVSNFVDASSFLSRLPGYEEGRRRKVSSPKRGQGGKHEEERRGKNKRRAPSTRVASNPFLHEEQSLSLSLLFFFHPLPPLPFCRSQASRTKRARIAGRREQILFPITFVLRVDGERKVLQRIIDRRCARARSLLRFA